MPLPIPLDLPTARTLEGRLRARIAPCVEVPVFTPEECRRIIQLRESLGFDLAPVPDRDAHGVSTRTHRVEADVRRTERTHLVVSPETKWIYDRVAAIVAGVNERVWRFDIDHIEPLQMLAYPAGGHFLWHSDIADRGIAALRKVSATILLCDPSSFTGGALQFLDCGREVTPGRGFGKGVLFPSFINHRVLPVETGTRWVLIVWTLGKTPLH